MHFLYIYILINIVTKQGQNSEHDTELSFQYVDTAIEILKMSHRVSYVFLLLLLLLLHWHSKKNINESGAYDANDLHLSS